MAKELHIRIDSHIGLLTDDFGFSWMGFMAYELEWHLYEVPNPERIVLHVNTPGGCVGEGIKIYNRLLELKKAGSFVEVINEGEVYSIGTFFAMAASPGGLKAREASMWCAHKPWIPNTGGTADDLRKDADELDSYESILVSAYKARTGKTEEEIKDHLRLDKKISSSEALAQGWIDSIIPNADVATAPAAKAAAAMKALAFIRPEKQDQQPNNTQMANTKQSSKWDKFKSVLQNFLAEEEDEDNDTPVAAETELEGGAILYHEGELAEGTAVFTDVEMTTPAADGDHKLANGKTITVAEGKVTAITDPEDPNAAALAEKDAEIQNLKDQLAAKDTAHANLQNQVNDLSGQITALKKTVPGGGDKTPPPAQAFKGDNPAGGHPLDKAAKQIKF